MERKEHITVADPDSLVGKPTIKGARIQAANEENAIARASKPITRMTHVAPAAGSRSGVRLGGIEAARLRLAPDFHEALTDDDLLRS